MVKDRSSPLLAPAARAAACCCVSCGEGFNPLEPQAQRNTAFYKSPGRTVLSQQQKVTTKKISSAPPSLSSYPASPHPHLFPLPYLVGMKLQQRHLGLDGQRG